MNISLAGKKILIIGGARGIGAQIVRDCAASGAVVAWTYFSSSGEKATEELSKELSQTGKEFLSFKVDSTDEQGTLELFNELRQKWGRIDGLVYNAGFTSPKDFCEISYEEWKRVVDINLNGAFLAVREGVQMMKDSGGGAIVLIGSAAITSGGGGRADYVAAKAGLEGLNRAVTKYFAKNKIRCNIVHPSLIETDLLCQRHPDPDKRKTLGEKEVPLGRLGQVEDISNAAIFLLSDQAGYITAQSILVDGGRSYCK